MSNLYHYTTIHGLIGILNSNEFWISKSTFMNDPGEIEYAWQFYMSAIQNHKNPKLFEPLVKWIEGILKAQDFFILSLSKEKDSLSLWSRYGQGYGYSIELNMRQLLAEIKNSSIGNKFKGFYEVSYEEDFNKKYVETLIVEYYQAQTINQNYPIDSEKIADLSFKVLVSLLAFKHKAYADEKEVRGIFALPNLNSYVVPSVWRNNISFRTQKNTKIPFMALKFQTMNWIKSIVLAPLNREDGDYDKITLLLQRKRITAMVVKSEIPYRKIT